MELANKKGAFRKQRQILTFISFFIVEDLASAQNELSIFFRRFVRAVHPISLPSIWKKRVKTPN